MSCFVRFGSALVASGSWMLTLGLPNLAKADPAPKTVPEIVRYGGQWSILAGGSLCVPGRATCKRPALTEGGLEIHGRTRPSMGFGAELGYRLRAWIFVGAAYRFGLFDPNHAQPNGVPYDVGYQHSVHGVVRAILPLWRLDLGLGAGPGFSRQTFRSTDGSKDFSQGFSFTIGPTLDVFVSPRVFLGVRADVLLNAHRDYCRTRLGATSCDRKTDDLGPIHQLMFGLHAGATFM